MKEHPGVRFSKDDGQGESRQGITEPVMSAVRGPVQISSGRGTRVCPLQHTEQDRDRVFLSKRVVPRLIWIDRPGSQY